MAESIEGHLAIDGEHRVVDWDAGAAVLTGVPAEQAMGRLCRDVVECRDPFNRAIGPLTCPNLKALDQGHPVGRCSFLVSRTENRILRFSCELIAHPLIPGGAVGCLRTVDAAMSRHPADPHPSRACMIRNLATLGALATSLSSSSWREDLQRVLDILREVTGAEAADLFLSEPGGSGAVLACHSGLFRQAFCEIPRFRPREGFPGQVLARRRALLSNRLPEDPRFLRTRVKAVGFLSYVCVPIPGPDGTLGSIGLAFRHPDADLEEAVRLLTWASGPISTALQAGLARMAESLVGPVDGEGDLEENFHHKLLHVLKKMTTLSRAEGGELYLRDQETGQLLRRITNSLRAPSPCPALQQATPARCPAIARGIGIALYGPRHSWASPCQLGPRLGSLCYCVPLITDGGPIGVVRLWHDRLGASPATRDLAVLETMAEAAGRAVREAWSYLEADRRARAVYATLLRDTSLDRAEHSAVAAPSGVAAAEGPGQEMEAPHLEIRCFGPFKLWVGGTLVTPDMVHRAKALTLLKILLVHDGLPLSKETLIEYLWPEGDPEAKAGQLYVLVHELRRLLEPQAAQGQWVFVHSEGDRYYFNAQSPSLVDVREFRGLVNIGGRAEKRGDAEAAIAAYDTAAELYRGDFMEDEPFAEWCWQEREFLKETVLDVLQRLAALVGRSGDWGRSVKYLRRSLRIDPVREEFHRELMSALSAAGRRDEAIRQYEACKEILSRELGVTPLPETERLLQQIRG